MFTKINQSSAIFPFIFDHFFFFVYILDFHTTCHNKQGLNRLTNYIGLYKAERREKKKKKSEAFFERETDRKSLALYSVPSWREKRKERRRRKKNLNGYSRTAGALPSY